MNCPRTNCKNPAIIDSILGVLPCEAHQSSDDSLDKIQAPEFYNLHKAYRIQKQRDDHGKDILQPYALGKDSKPNKDFLKAYPDRAKDYFKESELKKI